MFGFGMSLQENRNKFGAFFLYLHRVKESNQTSNVALAWFIEPQRSDLWWLISQKFIDTAIFPPKNEQNFHVRRL